MDGTTPVRREIRVSDIGQVFARFTDGFQYLAANPAYRQLMSEALIARYFSQPLPNQKSTILNRHSSIRPPRSGGAARIRTLTGLPPEDHRDLRPPVRRLWFTHSSSLCKRSLLCRRRPPHPVLGIPQRSPNQRSRPLQEPPLGDGSQPHRPLPGSPLACLQDH